MNLNRKKVEFDIVIRKLCLRLSEKKNDMSVAKSKDFQNNEMLKQGQWECFRKVKQRFYFDSYID